jgi:hypothetical protein
MRTASIDALRFLRLFRLDNRSAGGPFRWISDKADVPQDCTSTLIGAQRQRGPIRMKAE